MKYDKSKLLKFQERAKQAHSVLLDLGKRKDEVRSDFHRHRSLVREQERVAARLPKAALSEMNAEQLREALRRDQAVKLELGKEKFGDANTPKGRELRSDLIPGNVNRSMVQELAEMAEELSGLDAAYTEAKKRWSTANQLSQRLTEFAKGWDYTLRRGTPVGPSQGEGGLGKTLMNAGGLGG